MIGIIAVIAVAGAAVYLAAKRRAFPHLPSAPPDTLPDNDFPTPPPDNDWPDLEPPPDNDRPDFFFYKCRYCGRGFRTKLILWAHERICPALLEPKPPSGTGTIYGLVFRPPDYDPVVNARVVARSSPKGECTKEGNTGSDGLYEISGLVVGTYHLQVYDSWGNPLGYRSGIPVNAGQRVSCNIAIRV